MTRWRLVATSVEEFSERQRFHTVLTIGCASPSTMTPDATRAPPIQGGGHAKAHGLVHARGGGRSGRAVPRDHGRRWGDVRPERPDEDGRGEETRDEAGRDEGGRNAQEAKRRDEDGGDEEGRAGEGGER